MAPIKAWKMYIDAHTGALVNKISNVCTIGGNDVPAKTKTYYHGLRKITSYRDTTPDSLKRVRFSLVQLKRFSPRYEQKIQVYDYRNNTKQAPVITANFGTIYSDSATFIKDSIAGEIYWGLQNTIDFYDSLFARKSVNGKGHPLIGLAHFAKNYANANWSAIDTMMLYGDGDGRTLGPVVGVDITGHECTHGVTQFSAGLKYQAESGALNESFSDIMGTGVEFYTLGDSANWLIGEKVLLSKPGYLRSMSQPKTASPQQPDTYRRLYWNGATNCSAANDNCGVHTNSGIQNFWFYLLSAGGMGTNDNKFDYNVNGIGLSKALQIAYRNLTVYLTSSSKHADAVNGSLQAAEDLYGAGSAEQNAVRDAWCAVGIGCQQDTCMYSLASYQKNVNGNAGNDSLKIITSGSDCKWNATTSSTFIHISNAAGSGTGPIQYTFDKNPGPLRNGIIMVNSSKFTVYQSPFNPNAIANPYPVEAFNIYPNPGTGLFYLDAPIKPTEIVVYTIDGKLVEANVNTANPISMDISLQKAGVYFVKLKINDTYIYKKIVKQ